MPGPMMTSTSSPSRFAPAPLAADGGPDFRPALPRYAAPGNSPSGIPTVAGVPQAPASAYRADQLAIGGGNGGRPDARSTIARFDSNKDGYLSGKEIPSELRAYAYKAVDGRDIVSEAALAGGAIPMGPLNPTPSPSPTPGPTPQPQPVGPAKPATPVAPSEAQAFADKVLELTNVERTKRGLKPFTKIDGLDAVATKRSQDMVDRRYFSHTDPDGKSPFYHIKQAGIPHRMAAENIAYGQQSPEAVVRTWMNSSGHRANILNPGLTHLGVGAVKSGNGQYYWTQLFTAD